MRIKKIYIDNYKIFQKFELDFTYNGKSQNLIVLAGINGSGKTTLLRDFIYHTFQKKVIFKNSYIDIELSDNTDNIQINTQTLKPTSHPDQNYRDSVLFPKFKTVRFYTAGGYDKRGAEESIIQFIDNLIYEKDKKSSEAYQAVQDILNEIFFGFDIQVEFKGINQEREILFKNSISEKIKIHELSGGEQELITKAFSLYLSGVKDSIILIDEPESSLHPNWQNRIAGIYQNFADKNNNQVIMATHSPHIVASVGKEKIRTLIKEGESVQVISDFSGSLGWRVDKVLLDIFRLSSLRSPIIENQLQGLKEQCYKNEFENPEFINKMQFMENLLGYNDIDLTLLRFEIAKRKKKNAKN